jgi:hypothetical protein
MKLKNILSSAAPHLLIILGFLVVSLIYNYPILEGNKLLQNDMIQAQGSAQMLQEFKKETGTVSLWAPSMFGGMPAFMIYMDYPMSLTTRIGRFITYSIPSPANLLFLYMLGFYLMAIMLGYRKELAILGAIGFAFASYSVINIEAGHVSKVIAVAFLPPFVGAVIMTYRGKILLGSALVGIFAGIELYANHIQITYYAGLALILYAIYELIIRLRSTEDRSLKLKEFAFASIALAIAGTLSIGSHASRLMVSYSYAEQSNRGGSELKSNTESKGGTDRDYAFQWSYGKMETFTYLIPNFYGGGSGSGASLGEKSKTYQLFQENGLNPQIAANMPYYWGAQPFTSGPAYMGAIVCFLFVLGMFLSKNSIKWWLLSVVILFTMLAWGKNFAGFNNFVFDYIPLYNKFRAVTMVLSIIPLFLVWGAILGLQTLFEEGVDKAKARYALQWSGGIVGGLILFFALLGGSFQNYTTNGYQESFDASGKKTQMNQDDLFTKNLSQQLGNNENMAQDIMQAIRSDRAAMQRNDAWRSFIFVALAFGVLWFAFGGAIPPVYAVSAVALLMLVDMWGVDWRYLNDENFVKPSRFEAVFDPTEADKKILADKTLSFRVLNTTVSPFNDATTSYWHQSIGGYHGAKLRRYQDVIEQHLGQNNRATYNMLNTKYFIVGGENGQPVAQENPEALGNAWFVKEFKIVNTPDEEINALKEFNPAQTAFIDKDFEVLVKILNITPDPKASIKLTKNDPNYLVYESNTTSPQLAIFSEVYYVNKGKSEWQAYIDGKPVPHLRADYILRGLVIPGGKHKIEFKFDSQIYHLGETIALICSLILLLGLGFAIFKAVSAKKED